MDLQMGANAPVAGASARIRLALPSGAEIDVTALVTYAGDKVRGDGDMCFFHQASVHGGAAVLSRPSPAQAELAIDFARLPADAEKVVLTTTIDGSQTFGSLSGALTISLDDTTIQVPTSGRSEKALILAEALPPAEAAQIISLARAAFEQSFTGVTLAAAVILVLVALVIRAKTGRDTTPVGAIRPHH